ncbi:MAG: GAF domain-containing protein [Chloroflexi bacterium]|nr:MAG: GAF domain-containing protein [Chloroflexota bacterium]
MATILYIDPDETAQQNLQALLEPEHTLVQAADGSTAVQYCAMLQPDLIILTPHLPDTNAAELFSRLKMFMPQTPILALAPASGAKPPPADDVVPLPASPETLLGRVQALLPPPPTDTLPVDLTHPASVAYFSAQIAALNQANRRLASINTISALIGASLDLEHLMDEILAQIHKTIDFDSATLFLLKGDVLEAAASRGLSGFRRGMNSYPRNPKNSAWQVVANKLPLIIADVSTSDYWEPRPELAHVRSWLGVPLISKGRVVGVLTLDKNKPHAFTEADARYLFTLAYQIAIAVENAQLFQSWEEQATRLKLINEVGQEISTLLDVNDLFDALARAIYERLNYAWVSIWEVDETRSRLTCKAMYGLKADTPDSRPLRHSIDSGLLGRVIASGLPLLVNNTASTTYLPAIEGLAVRSVLAVPLFVGSQIEAVICAATETPGGFSDHDVWTLSSLANHAGAAVRNAWLYRGLDTYSNTLERTIAARNQRLQAIKKISQIASQGLEVSELIPVARRDIAQIFTTETVGDVRVDIGILRGSRLILNQTEVLTLAADTLVEQVIRQNAPRLLQNVRAEEFASPAPAGFPPSTESMLMTPLVTAGKTIGVIAISSQEAGAFDDSDLETLETIAYQIAGAVEYARLLQKAREIAIVEERTRLARDMHDGIAQNLAYLLLQVERGLNMVEEGSKIEAHLEKIGQLLRQNIDELRRNIFDLRPLALEGQSIFNALERFVEEFGRRWNIQTRCTIQGPQVDVPPDTERALYRILQEALSNAQRHANCRTIQVALVVNNQGWLELTVQDDGQGFDTGQPPTASRGQRAGLGLVSMQERAFNLGGNLTIHSRPGEGTTIQASLPLAQGE